MIKYDDALNLFPYASAKKEAALKTNAFFVSESQVTKCGFARVRCIFGMARHFWRPSAWENPFLEAHRGRERGKKPIGTRCKPDRQTELLWQP